MKWKQLLFWKVKEASILERMLNILMRTTVWNKHTACFLLFGAYILYI